jgi:nicotinate-nucleotide adenylyltransferase
MPDRDKAPEKIALFGGTFDPVHLGHIHLARSAVDALGLDQVRFLPCRISPHKLGSSPTPAADRLEMLKLATAELPWAVVDDFETRIEGPSFSYRTAEEMAARFPGARLFWIMGGDQWVALDQWAEPRRLAACVEFIVFTRGEPLMEREGFLSHALTADHPASATAIRETLSDGAEKHDWLDPRVSRWIREHHLYRRVQ